MARMDVLDEINPASSPLARATDEPYRMAAEDVKRDLRSELLVKASEPLEEAAADTAGIPEVPPETPVTPQGPRIMSLQAFAEAMFPEIVDKRVVPKGTNARVRQAYGQYLQHLQAQRGARQEGREAAGADQQMKLGRFYAQLAAMKAGRQINQDKLEQQVKKVAPATFKTFEAFAVDRMRGLPPDRWQSDPVINLWKQMKGVADGQKAAMPKTLEEAAVAEMKKTPRDQWDANPIIRLYREIKTPGAKGDAGVPSVADQRANLLLDATKGMEPKDAYTFATSPARSMEGERAGSLSSSDLHEELFGQLGYGGLVQKLEGGGPRGYLEAYRAVANIGLFADQRQQAALAGLLERYKPTVQEVIEAGPRFRGADGTRHGTGELTEAEVEELLQAIMSPEEIARLQARRQALPAPAKSNFEYKGRLD